MKATVLVYLKIKQEEHFSVEFALCHDGISAVLPTITDFECFSMTSFSQKNLLTRQEAFDWDRNQNQKKVFLFEFLPCDQQFFPTHLFFKEQEPICWKTFPQAVQALKTGHERNLLQLAVQYISSGGMMNSVIAADYDSRFLA